MYQRLLRGALPLATALAVIAGCLLAAADSAAADPTAPAAGSAGTGSAGSPDLASQWWLTALGVTQAWKSTTTGSAKPGAGVTVAVLSTGVSPAHPDLTGDVVTGPDYSDSGRGPGGEYWGSEGTAVASLIAGHGHGSGGTEGITGIAPGATILSIRVTLEYNDPLNSRASSVTRNLPGAIAEGIGYAVSHGATVIALPLDPGTLGLTTTGDPSAAGGSAAEQSAVADALAHNVVLVAPAGDDGAGLGTANYPAAFPGVIAVGATKRSGRLAPFTSRQSYVALTAPGSGLVAAAPDGGYDRLATTDMSAALTAGVAALIRAKFPALSAAQVTQALKRAGTASPSGASPGTGTAPPARAAPGTGAGRLDAVRALQEAAAIAAPPATSPATTSRARTSRAATGTPARGARSVASTSAEAGNLANVGTEARSVLRDATIGAGALIVVLLALLLLTSWRRRARVTRQRAVDQAESRLARGAARSSQGTHAARAEHLPFWRRAALRDAANQSVASQYGSRYADAPASPSPASTPNHALPANQGDSIWKGLASRAAPVVPGRAVPENEPWAPARRPADTIAGAAGPAGPPGAATADTGTRARLGRRGRPRIVPVAKIADSLSMFGVLGKTGGLGAPGRQAPRKPADRPPWDPASPPAREPAPPPAPEPAPTPPVPQKSLPPWEQSHDSFFAASIPADMPDWPLTSRVNTGPMYVWNPAVTGPIPVPDPDEEDEEDEESE